MNDHAELDDNDNAILMILEKTMPLTKLKQERS